jgi:hypothetical protein
MVLHAKDTKKEVNIECGVRERDFQSVTEEKKKTFPFSYPTERKCVAAQGGKERNERQKNQKKIRINTKIKSSRRFFWEKGGKEFHPWVTSPL